jgi:hypothetical protein
VSISEPTLIQPLPFGGPVLLCDRSYHSVGIVGTRLSPSRLLNYYRVDFCSLQISESSHGI